jgi:hypothetical protein
MSTEAIPIVIFLAFISVCLLAGTISVRQNR